MNKQRQRKNETFEGMKEAIELSVKIFIFLIVKTGTSNKESNKEMENISVTVILNETDRLFERIKQTLERHIKTIN